MLTIWARTQNNLRVRGVAALASMPLHLITTDPEITELADGREVTLTPGSSYQVADHAEATGVRLLEHTASPGHPLERLAELVALTDFAATYLAIGHGLDPATVPGISDLHLPRKALG